MNTRICLVLIVISFALPSVSFASGTCMTDDDCIALFYNCRCSYQAFVKGTEPTSDCENQCLALPNQPVPETPKAICVENRCELDFPAGDFLFTARKGDRKIWSRSEDNVLAGTFTRAPASLSNGNKLGSNWAIGFWQKEAQCTQSLPCFACAIGYVEFFEDMTFKAGRGLKKECIPGEGIVPAPQEIGTEIHPLHMGTYRILNGSALELTYVGPAVHKNQ